MISENEPEKLFELLNSIGSVTRDDYELLVEISTSRRLEKGAFWLREGMVGKDVAYIKKGYLRKYYIQKGNDITDYFYLDGNFTGDLPSILSGNPTYSFIEAMENTELLVWTYESLNDLAEKSFNIEHLLRKITELGFVTFYNRTKSFITQSPKERYDFLMNEQPQILQRATQYHIASFLGITPQHLSRIRASK